MNAAIRLRSTLATAALCLAAAVAVARGVPQPGPAPAVRLPPSDTLMLPNGLTATLVPYGHVPKTSIVITVATGPSADDRRPGVARLAAELLNQGTRGHSAAQFYREAAQFGGAVSVSAGIDTVTVSIDVLEEYGSRALDLLADVLLQPTLPEAELPRLKADLKRELAVSHSQQQGLASETFARQVYGDTPRGHRLDEKDVEAVSMDDVRDFVRTELSAGRTRIYVAGRYDASAIKTAIRRRFTTWPKGKAAEFDRSTPTTVPSVTLIDRPGAKQSTVLIGIPVAALKAPDYPDLSLANAVLGGAGLMSRLDQNLREDKGWTYGVQSQIEPLSAGGLWVLFADVNTPDTANALREIFSEISKLETIEPEAAELTRIKNYRAGHFLLGASSREGLIGQVAFVDRYDLGVDWLPGYLQRLDAVTPDGVRKAAAQLAVSRMTLVVAGDLSAIKYGLEGIEALKGVPFH